MEPDVIGNRLRKIMRFFGKTGLASVPYTIEFLMTEEG